MTNKPKLPPMPEPADKRGVIVRDGLLHYCPVYTEDQVRQAMLDAIALNATGVQAQEKVEAVTRAMKRAVD